MSGLLRLPDRFKRYLYVFASFVSQLPSATLNSVDFGICDWNGIQHRFGLLLGNLRWEFLNVWYSILFAAAGRLRRPPAAAAFGGRLRIVS